MTDAFKSIAQGLKEAIAEGATTHHVVIDLVQATEYIKELEDKLAVAEAKLLTSNLCKNNVAAEINDTILLVTNQKWAVVIPEY
jgi:hypothetical protein